MEKASRDMLRRIYARKPQAPAPDPEQLYAAETLVRFKRPGFSLKHAMPNSRPAHWEPFSSRRAAPASSVPSSTRSYFPSSRKRILSSKQHRGAGLDYQFARRSCRSCGKASGVDALPWHLAQMHVRICEHGSVSMDRHDEARRLDPEEFTQGV